MNQNKPKLKLYCPYCEEEEHFLDSGPEFKQLSGEKVRDWISFKCRCWRCGRKHSPKEYSLKKPCNTCKELHLIVLHEVIPLVFMVSTSSYSDRGVRASQCCSDRWQTIPLPPIAIQARRPPPELPSMVLYWATVPLAFIILLPDPDPVTTNFFIDSSLPQAFYADSVLVGRGAIAELWLTTSGKTSNPPQTSGLSDSLPRGQG